MPAPRTRLSGGGDSERAPRASHANGARRRSGARESVSGSPRGEAPRIRLEIEPHRQLEPAWIVVPDRLAEERVVEVRIDGVPRLAVEDVEHIGRGHGSIAL